ncbi:Transposase IS4 [Popillia japonica]|uniref:Transposase IS4 n=1 Tax=Popillia japonica TaxID=7064 RepID=A0AAW1LZN7_POPJA
MGTIRINRIQDYWKQDELFGLGAFARNMSRNRFLLIQRCLHFAKNPEQGKDKPGMADDLGGKGHTEKVVMDLLKEKLNARHIVYMDNCYNSFKLAQLLLENRTYCTGTLRIDRTNCPKEVKALNVGGTLENRTYCTGTLRIDRTNCPKEVKAEKLNVGGTSNELRPRQVNNFSLL